MAGSLLNTEPSSVQIKTNDCQEIEQFVTTKQFINDYQGTKDVLEDQTVDDEIIFPSDDDETCLVGLEKEQLNSLCPWLNITDPVSCINEVNLDNIELYLECSDDGENAGVSDVNHVIPSQGSHVIDQEGTSVIKSDVQLKISFPDFQDEKDKGFKCCCCKRKFAGEYSLRDHVSVEHLNKAFVCPLCTYNTKSKKFFQNHMNTKHKESPNTCGQSHASSYETYAEENITVYILTTDNEKLVSESSNKVNTICENGQVENGKCDSVMKDNAGVSMFYDITKVLRNTDSPDSINDREDFNFSDTQNVHVDDNLQNVTRDNFISAGVPVTTDTGEQGSEDREVESSKFTCEECGFVTKSRKLLKCHQLTKHNDKREKLACTVCGFECLQKRTLDSHMTLHVGGHQYTCTVCKKGFLSKYSYKRHIKTHYMERKFACDYKQCGKMFKTKGAVTDHKRKVHGMKNFNATCLHEKNMTETITLTPWEHSIENESTNNCTSRTVRKDDNVHKQYNREITFSDKISKFGDFDEGMDPDSIKEKLPADTSLHLTKGTQTHVTNELTKQNKRASNSSLKQRHFSKKFLCPYVGCSKSFRDNFNLKNHICTHDGVKKLRCEFCDFACVQKTSLNHHYENKHGRK